MCAEGKEVGAEWVAKGCCWFYVAGRACPATSTAPLSALSTPYYDSYGCPRPVGRLTLQCRCYGTPWVLLVAEVSEMHGREQARASRPPARKQTNTKACLNLPHQPGNAAVGILTY